MKNNYTGLALGVALALGATTSNADSYGAGVAFQNVKDIDSGVAIVLNADKTIDSVSDKFSVEGEFTYSVASPGDEETISGNTLKAEFTILTLAAYGVYSHPINEKLSVFGRAGILYESISTEVCLNSLCANSDEDETETGLSYGAGFKYSLSDSMAVRFDYTLIEADVSHLGLGVSMNF